MWAPAEFQTSIDDSINCTGLLDWNYHNTDLINKCNYIVKNLDTKFFLSWIVVLVTLRKFLRIYVLSLGS